MGRHATAAFPFGLLGGPKRGLQTELQGDIIQEIEALLGQQSMRELDLEAVEMAAGRQALRRAARALEQRLNADTSDHAGPELPCSCGEPAQYRGRHQKTLKACWDRCVWSGPIITAPSARVDSARATALCGWSCFRSPPGFCAGPPARRRWSASRKAAPGCTSWREWRAASATGHGPPRHGVPKSLLTNASRWNEWAKSRRPGTWGWMAPASPCAPRKSPAAPASSRMAPPKPARPSSLLCGPRNREMRRASLPGIRGQSLIRPRSKAPLPAIRIRRDPTSPSGYCGKRHGGAFPTRTDAECSAG